MFHTKICTVKVVTLAPPEPKGCWIL